MGIRAAVITISTSRARNGGEDESGDRLTAFVREQLGAEIAGRDLIPDDRGTIEDRLRHWADDEDCDLILTTGGTGFSPSDLTPEATVAVIDRLAPGLPEAMRLASKEHTRHWMLSRGAAGIRGSTLIINFPGSPASISQAAEAIAGSLPHALNLLADGRDPHPPGDSRHGMAGRHGGEESAEGPPASEVPRS